MRSPQGPSLGGPCARPAWHRSPSCTKAPGSAPCKPAKLGWMQVSRSWPGALHLDRRWSQGHDAQPVQGCVAPQLHQDVDAVLPDQLGQGALLRGRTLPPRAMRCLNSRLQASSLGVCVRGAVVHIESHPAAHQGCSGARASGLLAHVPVTNKVNCGLVGYMVSCRVRGLGCQLVCSAESTCCRRAVCRARCPRARHRPAGDVV